MVGGRFLSHSLLGRMILPYIDDLAMKNIINKKYAFKVCKCV